MPNPGDGDAIRLIGCYGDGNRNTVDLILDVNGNGRGLGTGSDAVRIGQNARNLVVTGDVECGRKHSDPGIHQDIVQALSGRNILFKDFTSGNPATGRWTCWGAGGGWYITWANGNIPTNLICLRCRLATYNQNLRIGESIRSGARNSVFSYHRSYGIFIEDAARQPVNVQQPRAALLGPSPLRVYHRVTGCAPFGASQEVSVPGSFPRGRKTDGDPRRPPRRQPAELPLGLRPAGGHRHRRGAAPGAVPLRVRGSGLQRPHPRDRRGVRRRARAARRAPSSCQATRVSRARRSSPARAGSTSSAGPERGTAWRGSRSAGGGRARRCGRAGSTGACRVIAGS